MAQRLDIAIQIAEALQAAHSCSFIGKLGIASRDSAGGSSARPRSRLSHSSSAPAVNTPPSSAYSTRSATLHATVGNRPASPRVCGFKRSGGSR